VASDLAERGFAVHVVGEHRIQLCTTERNDAQRDALVEALEVVA
jgi:glycine dehydrogenase subunit 1